MNKKVVIIGSIAVVVGSSLWYWLVYNPSITQQQQMNGTKTAGGGFNNPGNFRIGKPVYNGEVDSQGAAFRWFQSMPYGLRAIIVLYRYYYRVLGKTTIRQAVATYAPPSDGNDDVAYDKALADGTGVDIDADMHDLLYTESGAILLMKAITKVEQGSSFLLSDTDCIAAYNLLPIIS